MPVRKLAQNSFLKIQLVENKNGIYVAVYEPFEDGTSWRMKSITAYPYYYEASHAFVGIVREYEKMGTRFTLERG